MSTRDDDILDFDFFDEEDATSWEEPEGTEIPAPSPERGRRGRGSGFRPPRNLTPLLRLIGLIALAILVIVLLVVWVEGCTESAQRDRNSTYLADIGAIGNASAKLGQQVSTLLTTPGPERGGPGREARRLRADGRQRRCSSAADLNAPGAMVVPNAGAVESLRYRANGLRGLQAAFKEATDQTDASVAGELLLAQTRRLLASDVIWTDSFQEPAKVVLSDEGIEGLDVPSSQFVTADDLVSQSSLAAIWQRIQGASTGGTPTGLHGSGIAYVKALPSGQLLSTTTETTIKVTEHLAVRGRRRGHGREPGGQDQGHADDPEAADSDRQDGHDPDHRRR